MTKWEYVSTQDENSLNALGQEGWELVGTVLLGDSITFYFKRPQLPLRDKITVDQRDRVSGRQSG